MCLIKWKIYYLGALNMSQSINLGSMNDVKKLFSYPNNCHIICYNSQSLEETVKHYVATSIKRDGFLNSEVDIKIRDGNVYAIISGDASEVYTGILQSYLDVGMLAYHGSVDIQKDGKWRYNWRFFLPHGVSMACHRTVQLLHFPPDYVLEQDQDYLTAHTTVRWSELLTENGIVAEETPQYQNIIDIAPIAAPSRDGRRLNGIYHYYNNYILGLLQLWVCKQNEVARPIVAFGSPVRKWIMTEFGRNLKVLSLTDINLPNGVNAPTLAANHPSFIYNVTKRLYDDPNTPEDERMGVLMRVMQQDLIAARWQSLMGQNPKLNPNDVLKDCKRYWGNEMQKKRICILVRTQALNENLDEAVQYCTDNIKFPFISTLSEEELIKEDIKAPDDPIGKRLEILREEIGDFDSREPDQIDEI